MRRCFAEWQAVVAVVCLGATAGLGACGSRGLAAGAGGAAVPSSGAGGAAVGGAGAAGGREAGAYEPAPIQGFTDIKLYPGDPPNLIANPPQESVEPNGKIHDVSIPALRRYPLDESKATGTAFVVFPGGGYVLVDMENNAAALARRLGPLGIAVFGLKYRVGGGSSDVPRDALLDAKRSIRLLRSKADLWALDPKRIGVVGHSAGSQLAMSLVAGFDPGQVGVTDPVELLSSRPDFVAAMSTFGGATSPFMASAPPVYMCHAQDDTIAPIGVANAIEQQLKALGVLSHLEVYPTGGHFAFDVGDPNAPGRNWPDNYLPWLKSNQLTF